MRITGYDIELQDIHIYAHHGVMPQEREVGAWFIIDIKLTMNDCRCTENDNIEGTVSYADIYGIICNEMKTPSDLLEHVAGRIVHAVTTEFPQLSRFSIRVSKKNPPVDGPVQWSRVTLTYNKD